MHYRNNVHNILLKEFVIAGFERSAISFNGETIIVGIDKNVWDCWKI